MINFQQLETTAGDHIYFQRLPGVKSVCVRLMVFVGSADDSYIGVPGIYHWFEHVPFRGTQKYPGGAEDTIDRFDRRGGNVNAHTTLTYTSFYAHVPSLHWKEALDLVVDLVGAPLLTDVSIEAERVIIQQEIRQRMCEPRVWFRTHVLPEILGSHPLSSNTLGTEKSLSQVSPDLVKIAYKKGYDRNRCALIVAGDLDPEEIISEYEVQAQRLPSHGLEDRNRAPACGAFPVDQWQGGRTVTVGSPFSTSHVVVLFPLWPQPDHLRWCKQWDFLADLYDGPESIAMKTLRQEQKLVYGVDVNATIDRDFGMFRLEAACSRKKCKAVIQAWRQVLGNESVLSPERLKMVLDANRYHRLHMRVPDPKQFTSLVEDELADYGRPISDEEDIQLASTFTRGEMKACADYLTPERAQTFIVKERRKWFF